MNIEPQKSGPSRVPASAVAMLSAAAAFACLCCASVGRSMVAERGIPAVPGTQGDTVQTRPRLDTVLIRGVEMSAVDSLYVLLADTAARVLALRIVSTDGRTTYGEIAKFERDIDPTNRAYAFYNAHGAAAYVRPGAARVDLEVVIAGDGDGALELGINGTALGLGGPGMIDVKDSDPVEPMPCGAWSVRTRSGCGLRVEVFPLRPRRAPSVRTMYIGSARSDTTVAIGWNCLKDDGARAEAGMYRVQVVEVCAGTAGTRVMVESVRVGRN